MWIYSWLESSRAWAVILNRCSGLSFSTIRSCSSLQSSRWFRFVVFYNHLSEKYGDIVMWLKRAKILQYLKKKLIIDPLWTLYHSSEIRAGNVTLSLTESHVLVVCSLGTFSSFVLVISRFWALSSIKWTAIHTLWRISSLSSFELDASYHGERSSFSIRMNLVVGLEVLPISTHWPPHKPGQGVGQWSNLRKVGSNFILTFRFDKVLKFRSSWRV